MNLHYDTYQWERPHPFAVSAETKLTYQDYSSMNVQTRKQSGERRLPTPVWAVNDEFLRKLLVVFMEQRFQVHTEGTLIERREALRQHAIAQCPRFAAKLDELNARYVELGKQGAPPARLRRLEMQIENLDTVIRTTHNGGMDYVAAVVFFYYRVRLDSVGVGLELGIKPPHVRVMLFRLHQLWKVHFNDDGTEKPRAGRAASAEKVSYTPKSPKMGWSLREAILLRIFGFTYRQIGKRLNVKPGTVAVYFQTHKIVVPVLKPAKEQSNNRDGEHVPHFDWKQAVELYQNGVTAAEVARRFRVSDEAVRNALRRAGVHIRSVAEARLAALKRFDWEQKAVELYRDGWSTHQVAGQLGVSGESVRLVLNRHGVKMRSKSEALKLLHAMKQEPNAGSKEDVTGNHEPQPAGVPARTVLEEQPGWVERADASTNEHRPNTLTCEEPQ